MKMKTPHPQISFLLTCMLATSGFSVPVVGGLMNNTGSHNHNHNNNKYSCISHEREALHEFKDGVIDNNGSLISWGDYDDQRDCCQYDGVSCSNLTGRVIGLDLSLMGLGGSISSALANMSALSHLDLSANQFQGPLTMFFANMTALSYLDLSFNQFQGPFLMFLSNMTALSYLDLSSNRFQGPLPMFLANMTALSLLDLSFNRFQGPLPMFLANMTALSLLNLSNNRFEGPFPMFLANMTALSHLDLSNNRFQGLIPANVFGNMSTLSYLDLSYNHFEGLTPIPASLLRNMSILSHPELSYSQFERSGWPSNILGNLCSLETLSLSDNSMGDELSAILNAFFGQCANNSLMQLFLNNNQIWGSVPDMIGTFSSLKALRIANNTLNGTISYNLGQLSLLEELDISDNFLQGTLSHNHLSNLSMLSQLLDVSQNPSLVVDISSDWIPPFQLSFISMSSCKVGPQFPKWLSTQKEYQYLDISNSGISDTIPPSFWNSSPSNLIYFNVSLNKIYGVLPTKLKLFYSTLYAYVDLSSNLFEGTIPSFVGTLFSLFLNNNKFTNVTPLLCPENNKMMVNLDLSNNLLSGELPNCWTKFSRLQSLHLENNNFSGNLPISISSLKDLNFLHLRNNSFSGELFTFLQTYRNLIILDAGYNSFTEHIPRDIGSHFGNIGILNLRNNNFSGRLPLSLCELLFLQILDISSNYISGTIPSCIKGFTAMTSANHSSYILKNFPDVSVLFPYADNAMVMWKRREFKYKNNLGLVKSIDVSHNKLEGQIPSSISLLKGLVSLDLSGNKLVGSIPPEIGQLISIEFLDLSNNHLSGQIPESLANMNSLGVLDLSNNNLSGKIPSDTQLQRFDALPYMGNPQLCGPPLQKCPGDDPAKAHRGDQDESNVTDDDDIFLGLYISVVFGFIIGFWGVCGTLVIKRSWRIAYFRFVDDLKDKIW